MKKIVALLLFIGLMYSCATKDDVVYFNGMNSTDNAIGLDSYSPTYHVDDELVIIVNALDAEAARPFNKSSVSVSLDILDARGRERIQTYRVDPDGNVNFPVLGKIKIPGYPASFSGSRVETKTAVPDLGEHTEEVLVKLGGFSLEEISKLRDEGVC